MKLLMTTDTVGGVWTYSLDLARALADFDIEVHLCTMGAPISLDQWKQVSALRNVTVHPSVFKLEWMDDPWDDVRDAGLWMREIQERVQPDLVHLNGYAHAALGVTRLYQSVDELQSRYADEIGSAHAVIVGSYVPEGVAVGQWVTATASGLTAFYDIDTPVTLAKLQKGDFEYLSPDLIRHYDLYLSFTGGPTLELLEQKYGSPCARPLYCSFDPSLYYPDPRFTQWDLGYLGTYSADRQPPLEDLLIEPARALSGSQFVVAGPQYPEDIEWPENVQRIAHLPPAQHREFYNAQRFTLNITRADMIKAGYSPSVRLFEAAACAVPIISDYWNGLESLFEIGREILVAYDTDDVLRYLRDTSDAALRDRGERARQRILAEHTAAHRAAELETYILDRQRGVESSMHLSKRQFVQGHGTPAAEGARQLDLFSN